MEDGKLSATWYIHICMEMSHFNAQLSHSPLTLGISYFDSMNKVEKAEKKSIAFRHSIQCIRAGIIIIDSD